MSIPRFGKTGPAYTLALDIPGKIALNKGILFYKENPMKQVEVYTDGACSGNPGPGGWGAVLRYRFEIGRAHV